MVARPMDQVVDDVSIFRARRLNRFGSVRRVMKLGKVYAEIGRAESRGIDDERIAQRRRDESLRRPLLRRIVDFR